MGDITDVMGGHDFDCNEVEPQSDFEPLPAGWYSALIETTEIKATKSGTGFYLKVQFSILDEPYVNRKVFANLNLQNVNRQAEEIGMRELSALGRATGQLIVKDSAELINKTLQIKLKVKDDAQYGPQNEVKGYKAIGGVQAQAPQAAPPSSSPTAVAAPASATAGVPPWKRK